MLRVSNNPAIDTVAKLVVVAVAMFAFVFAVMVPLYNVLCDALDESREVTVQFVATNNAGMPWEFRPSKTIMAVNPGASNETVFLARNPTPDAMVAQAIPSVSPARAAEYFHKTECFCFDQQPLDGRASAEMPLQFIIDRDLPKDISTITLSYTIFDVTSMARGAVAAR